MTSKTIIKRRFQMDPGNTSIGHQQHFGSSVVSGFAIVCG
jgi:hypothetical protein